jgi:hypothetical protein
MNNNRNNHVKKEAIVIFSGHVARELLKRGFTIVDLKPDKTNNLKSVFVFKVENDIEKHIRELTSNDIKESQIHNNLAFS